MTTLTSINTEEIPTLEELGHPGEVKTLASLTAGVILVSGKHGSGKSTTVSSLAKEIYEATGQRVVEVTAENKAALGFPYFTIEDRQYAKVSKNSKAADLEAARRYALIESAAILNEDVKVALFDDIRHPEAALIASYLAGAGVLVIASIHNSGDVQNTVKNFVELPGKLTSAPLDTSLVKAVVHQSLSRDGAKPVLSSAVSRP